MEIRFGQLNNGLQYVHCQNSKHLISHLGAFINTGSRFEKQGYEGITHFIEHLLFKGTHKRKAFHILNRLDSVGGELNAYTTKEETCLYASFLNRYYDRAFELLADQVFNSIFPEKEIEKEREVIIDEIGSYQDMPNEQIFDDFEEHLFKNNPIAGNILGTKKSLKQIGREKMLQYHAHYYIPSNMVVASVGNISYARFLNYLEKYFSNESSIQLNETIIKPEVQKQFQINLNKKTTQHHFIIGNQAYGANHPKHLTFFVLNNLLGGPSMNSRLNLAIREKYGFTYNLDSFYQTYSDCASWGVYASSDKKNAEKVKELIIKELKKLKEKKLGLVQLSQVKQQFIGQMAMNRDNGMNHLTLLGKNMLVQQKIESFNEIKEKVLAISALDLMDVSNEVFIENNFSQINYL